ncbi:MAG: magnesium transporter protein [Chloroflexi bacterium]|nr:magnesium transporter protein [Chloroflexota bacterium]
MITYYKNTENGLTVLTEPINNCWINVVDPTPEEVTRIQGLGVPADYITFPLDLNERARTERENGELLVILRIPFYQGETADIPYITIPLGIILTDKYVITVCKRDNEILQGLTSTRIRNLVTAKRLRFVLQIFFNTAKKYLAYLQAIDKSVDTLEDELQLSSRNKELLALLKYQKSLTFFTTALKSNELLMERLQRSQLFRTYPEDEDLLEDVLTENQQAIEMTNISTNILSSMMDAFASIISNNLNVVMKLLTSITIVISIPTMITSFFGMNVHLPFEALPFASGIILLISLGFSTSVAYFFWKRDWF